MQNTFELNEHSGILDGYIYIAENFEIDFTIDYEDENNIYFKVFTNSEDSKCCRISMTKPEILDISDYIIDREDINRVIFILESNNQEMNMSYWDYLILCLNEARKDAGFSPINNLKMPDYRKIVKNL